ncbi:MAG: HAD family hydrolase [Bacillus subtilis]|nr:HAD family hydrolase [Bacillus subtilis]
MRPAVFGRVTPAQKKLLIETFRAANHKVAMVGDGVNDILAFEGRRLLGRPRRRFRSGAQHQPSRLARQ